MIGVLLCSLFGFRISNIKEVARKVSATNAPSPPRQG